MRPADLTTLERSRLHEALVSAFYDAGRLGNLRAVAFSALRAVPFLAQLAR
jgi:hypothetical protein